MFQLSVGREVSSLQNDSHPVVNVGLEPRQREEMKRGFYFGGKKREGV